MTWTVSRNNHIDNSVNLTNRAIQTLCLLKDRLKACVVPWTVVGSGSGTGGSYDMSGVDLLPSFPSLSGVADNCWICLQNVDGLQVIFRIGTGYFEFYFCSQGGYQSSGDESATNRPGHSNPPAKEVNLSTESTSFRNAGMAGTHYKSVAVKDDGKGFILFGKYTTHAAFNCSLLKCVGDPLDVDPYVGINFMMTGNAPWEMSHFVGTNYPASRALFHPTGQRMLNFMDPRWVNEDVFSTSLQVNPYSNKTQLLGIVVGATTNPYRFVKGTIPGILRVPDSRSMGDKFEDGELINMRQLAVPWGSPTDELI